MVEIAVTLFLVSCIAGYLVNKFLDQRQQENDRKHELNTKSAEAELSAAIEEGLKKFDSRINDTWGTISDVKQELNSLKMQLGFRNKH